MEQKVNVWKANLMNGLILALIGIAYSLVIYFVDLTFNKAQGYVFMIIQIGVLFFLLKSYRDNVLYGQITYGQSVGAGVIICLYYAICVAVFTYLLYSVIDPGLVGKSLAMAEEAMVKKNTPPEIIEKGMAITKKIMKPAIMAITSIFWNVFWGTIISLIVSIFIRKEGNPLIDSTETNQI